MGGASSSPASQNSGFHVPDEDNDSQSDVSEADSCEIEDSHPITFSVPSSGDELDDSDDDVVITAHRRSRALRTTKRTYKRLPSPELGESANQPDGQQMPIRTDSQAGSAVDPIDVEEALLDSNIMLSSDSEDEEMVIPVGFPNGEIADEITKPSSENDAATSFSSRIRDTNSMPTDLPSQMLDSQKDEMPRGVREMEYLSPYCIPGNREQDSDGDENIRVQRDESTVNMSSWKQNTATTCSTDVGSSIPSLAHTHEPPEASLPSFVEQAAIARRQRLNAANHPRVERSTDLDLLCRPVSPPRISVREVSPIAYSQVAEDGSDYEDSSEGESDWLPPHQFNPHTLTHGQTFSEKPKYTAFPKQNPLAGQEATASSSNLDPSYLSNPSWPRPLARAPSPSDAALARKATADSGRDRDGAPANNHLDDFFDDAAPSYRSNRIGGPYRIRLSEAPWHSTPYVPPIHRPMEASAPLPQRDHFDDLLRDSPARLPSHRPEKSDYEEGPFSKNYRSLFHSVAVPPLPRGSIDRSASPPIKRCLVKLNLDKASNIVREKRVAKPPSRKSDGKKPTKLEISDLINPHAEGPQILKRKADQLSSEEVEVAPQGLAVARDQKDKKTVAEAGWIKTSVQDATRTIVDSASQEGPARKKVKLSGSKAGTVGKIVSGVCLGLVGALSAFVYSTPAEVWEEALREAVQLS